MEEQKINNSNEETQETDQPSYEELYKAYMDLAQKHQYVVQQLREANSFIQTYNRLDYMFKVLDVQNESKTCNVFHDDFYQMCIDEIEKIMTPQEKPTEDKKEN